jgi:putative SOS response-associated peptidase YedK
VCGRYSITLPPEAIRAIFQTHGELPNWPAQYNAAPTTALPIVRQAKDGQRSGADELGPDSLVLQGW